MASQVSNNLQLSPSKFLEISGCTEKGTISKPSSYHTGWGCIQGEAGHPPPAQRRRYLNANQRLVTIVDDFANRNILDYLRAIAHNLAI